MDYVEDHTDCPGAEAVRDFVPSRDELLSLYARWMRERLDIEALWVLYASSAGAWCRTMWYAERRMGRIAQCLGGPEAVASTRDKTLETFLRDHRLSQVDWEAAIAGDAEVLTRLREPYVRTLKG